MPIDFSRLEGTNNKKIIEPRDIFMMLPLKDKYYGYPRDVQTEVWKKWFKQRNEKNNIIKMNTGSGKTVVGLLILQSCLNEIGESSVYVVPDNYLVKQVSKEAKKLGIPIAYDIYNENNEIKEKGEENYYFLNGQAILITNIYKLVNGKSIFGMRKSGNINIGSVIIDDVHACLDTIEKQYTVMINSDHKLYNIILDNFAEYKEINDSQAFYEIRKQENPQSNMLIPFWIWQKKSDSIYKLLVQKEFAEDSTILFNLPLIKDNLKTCNCVISSKGIEITPKNIAINKILNFEQAQRRIFMSATLADDSVLVSTMGLKTLDNISIITPEKANDLGERLILFPKHLNSQISDESIKDALVKLAIKHNVVVIVPSFDRANFWGDVAKQVLSSSNENIEEGIDKLKRKHIGLTVLVNKYDGIDLPDDACRIIVIDGLPLMRSEYDLVIRNINPNDKRICREQMQKIEQGMGRGVRSNTDYCVIVFMGNQLSDVIINQNGYKFFSRATLEQYNLSKKIWEQLMESTKTGRPNITDIFNLAGYTLNRDKSWVSISKDTLASIEYDRNVNVDSMAIAIRNAFEKESIECYDEAFDIIQAEKNAEKYDDKTKGFLMQYMAEYKNFSDPAEAQELLLSAQKYNNMLLKPIRGIQFKKLQYSKNSQAVNVFQCLNNYKLSNNNLILKVETILDNLIFKEDSANNFEEALQNIASIIGINASRPEKETGRGGPDNLLVLENSKYAVIECKNGSVSKLISKIDCNQLNGSIEWFRDIYKSTDITCCPIMIHPTNQVDSLANPNSSITIMTTNCLDKFKSAIRNFIVTLVRDDWHEQNKIEKNLNYFRLKGSDFIKEYTVPYIKKK